MPLCIFCFYLTLIKLCQVGSSSLIFQMRKRRIKKAQLSKVPLPVSGGFSIQIYIWEPLTPESFLFCVFLAVLGRLGSCWIYSDAGASQCVCQEPGVVCKSIWPIGPSVRSTLSTLLTSYTLWTQDGTILIPPQLKFYLSESRHLYLK